MLILNLRKTLDLVFSPFLAVLDLGKLLLAKERLEGEKRSCQRRRRTCGACRSEEIPSFGACLRYKASCLTFILYRSMYFEALSPFLSQKSSPCCIFRFGQDYLSFQTFGEVLSEKNEVPRAVVVPCVRYIGLNGLRPWIKSLRTSQVIKSETL